MIGGEKIEAALTPGQWQKFRIDEIETMLNRGLPFTANVLASTKQSDVLAATIALANAALSDSDPRKITRDWLRTLRSEAKYVGSGGLESEYEDEPYQSMAQREAALRAIAAALESYLPPQPEFIHDSTDGSSVPKPTTGGD